MLNVIVFPLQITTSFCLEAYEDACPEFRNFVSIYTALIRAFSAEPFLELSETL